MKWDLFISHAHQDKTIFVDELASALEEAGYAVWYDKFCLRPGESLRRGIEEGLAESAAGVVVLSRHFFDREWSQRELDALTGQQISDGKRLVPIWLGIDADYVRRVSPMLADRVAIIANAGATDAVRHVRTALAGIEKRSDRELRIVVDQFFAADTLTGPLFARRSATNFRKLIDYCNGFESAIHRCVDRSSGLTDDELGDLVEREVEKWRIEAVSVLEIPANVYLAPTCEVSEEDSRDIEPRLTAWCAGTLAATATAELLYDLDEWLDLDYLYVFFGVPNFSVTPEQREELRNAVFRVGTRSTGESPDQQWSQVFLNVFDQARRRRRDDA